MGNLTKEEGHTEIRAELNDCNKSLEIDANVCNNSHNFGDIDIKTETCEEMDESKDIGSDSQICFVECKNESVTECPWESRDNQSQYSYNKIDEKDCHLKCTECDLVFKNKSDKLRHDKSIHSGKKLECEFCTKVFKCNRKDNLDRHIRSKHGGDVSKSLVNCNDCKMSFTSVTSLKRHIGAKHDKTGNAVNVCHICNTDFCSKKDLRKHLKKHQNVCDDCGTSFAKQSVLATHRLRGNLLSCKDCNVTVCNQRQMNKHKLTHHQKFQCDSCMAEFKSQSALKTHRLRGNLLSCTECNVTVCNQRQMDKHKLIHIEKFQCESCMTEFKKQWMLIRHKNGSVACERSTKKYGLHTQSLIKEEVTPDIKAEMDNDEDYRNLQNNSTGFIKNELNDFNKSLDIDVCNNSQSFGAMDIKTETCEEMNDENM